MKSDDNSGIKLESGLTNQEEEALVAKGWSRPGRGRGGAGGFRGTKTGGGHTKNINPRDSNGKPMICPSCGSFRRQTFVGRLS